MADLNDPPAPAKAEDKSGEPVVADKAAEAGPAAEPDKPVADAKPAATEPATAKPPAGEPAVAEPAVAEPAAAKPPAAEPADATATVEPAAEKPAEPVADTETKPAETKPAETKPAATEPTATGPTADSKPAATKPAAAESEPTVLPDSIVSGAEGATAASAAEKPVADKAGADGEAEEDDEDAAPDSGAVNKAKKPRKPLPRPRPLVAALSLLLVVLLIAGVALFVHNHKVSSAEASRLAALDTARDVATSLTTITPDNAAGQIDDLAKHSTGAFKDQIGGYSAMFQAVLKQGNVASRGTITAAGIEKMEGDAASAIVAVSALITSGQVPQGQPRTYRLLVSLQRNGDQWLASNVDFIQ